MLDQALPVDPPGTVAALDTPAVVIDLDIVERNLRRAQDYADAHGIALRPHIKTHKFLNSPIARSRWAPAASPARNWARPR